MQQATVTTLFHIIKTITEKAHTDSGLTAPLTLLWQLAEAKDLPDKQGICVYSHLEVHQDSEAAFGNRELYRVRGAVVQDMKFPKLDSFFHNSVRFAGILQDGWRKARDTSISFYEPFVMPGDVQPDQSFLQWQLKVVYDVFETI